MAYATFGLMGFYPMEEAYTLNQPHTKFPSHTDRKLTPGVDLTTGSLGQGISAAAGMAKGAKYLGKDINVYSCWVTARSPRARCGRPCCSPPTTIWTTSA